MIKKHKILNIHENLGSVFTADTYSHNKEVHKEIIFEKSFAEQLKLKKERLNEVKRKEQSINNELFQEYFTNYQSRSDMYKRLGQTKGALNEHRVYLIKKVLTKIKK